MCKKTTAILLAFAMLMLASCGNAEKEAPRPEQAGALKWADAKESAASTIKEEEIILDISEGFTSITNLISDDAGNVYYSAAVPADQDKPNSAPYKASRIMCRTKSGDTSSLYEVQGKAGLHPQLNDMVLSDGALFWSQTEIKESADDSFDASMTYIMRYDFSDGSISQVKEFEGWHAVYSKGASDAYILWAQAAAEGDMRGDVFFLYDIAAASFVPVPALSDYTEISVSGQYALCLKSSADGDAAIDKIDLKSRDLESSKALAIEQGARIKPGTFATCDDYAIYSLAPNVLSSAYYEEKYYLFDMKKGISKEVNMISGIVDVSSMSIEERVKNIRISVQSIDSDGMMAIYTNDDANGHGGSAGSIVRFSFADMCYRILYNTEKYFVLSICTSDEKSLIARVGGQDDVGSYKDNKLVKLIYG